MTGKRGKTFQAGKSNISKRQGENLMDFFLNDYLKGLILGAAAKHNVIRNNLPYD